MHDSCRLTFSNTKKLEQAQKRQKKHEVDECQSQSSSIEVSSQDEAPADFNSAHAAGEMNLAGFLKERVYSKTASLHAHVPLSKRTLSDCSSSFICLLFFICFVFLQFSICIVWNVRVIMLECHVLTQWACSHCFSICFPPGLPGLYIMLALSKPIFSHCSVCAPLHYSVTFITLNIISYSSSNLLP